MKHYIVTPLTGLLSHGEAALVIDAFNSVLPSSIVGPRDLLGIGVEDAIRFDELDAKWEIVSRDLLRKIKCLDAWEAQLLLDATVKFWQQMQNGGTLTQALAHIGLVHPEDVQDGEYLVRQAVVRYTCRHTKLVAAACESAATDPPKSYPAPVECLSCRVRTAHKTALKAGWGKFQGGDREVVRATEIRTPWLQGLEGRLAATKAPNDDPDRIMMEALHSHQAPITDPYYWVDGIGCNQEAAETGAIGSATAGQIKVLLSHHDDGIRALAFRNVPRAFPCPTR